MESKPCYRFTLKHRWSCKNNVITGITLPSLIKLVWRYGGGLATSPLYWHRLAAVAALSVVNWVFAFVEDFIYKRRIARQPLHPEPVFVLGHPRTGTTHLHNLLALDACRFATATTFQAGFPSGFLLLQRYAWLLGWALDPTRPMDNMPLSFTTPAEDEIAVNVLTGGTSPYAALTFMPSFRRVVPYCTFDGCPQREIDEWSAAFLWFLRKVTLAAGGCKPLVIKSPVHMGRLPLLLKLFPRAKFVFIHRDPLEVFQSSAHMADTYNWYCYLSRPSDEDVTDYILQQHTLLYSSYMRHRADIPKGNLVEVSFAELDAAPMATMQRIYAGMRWADFASVVPTFRQYCGQLEGFKKNDHRALPVGLRARVQREWHPVFKAFGYRA